MRLALFAAVVPAPAIPGCGEEVRDVYPGTDAAAQGLQPALQVVSVDERTITDLDAGAVSGLLGRFELGDRVPVGVLRGANIETYHIEVQDLLPRFEAP